MKGKRRVVHRVTVSLNEMLWESVECLKPLDSLDAHYGSVDMEVSYGVNERCKAM